MESVMVINLIKVRKNFAYIAVSLLLAFISMIAPLHVSAQTDGKASIKLTPNTAELTKNSTFSVTVSIDSGSQKVNVAQVDLAYDPAKLRFNEIDSSTSAYSAEVQESGGDGNINIARFVSPPGTAILGNRVFSKISFSVLSENTTADISILSSSAVAGAESGENIWDGNANPAKFQLIAALPGSTPVTDEPVESNIQFDNTDAFSRSSNATIENSSTLQNENPEVPISVNTSEITFDTYLVAIRVLDGDVPIPNAEVTISEQTALTDVSGTASFIGFADGAYIVDIQVPGREDLYSSTIFIPDTAELSEVQEFEFDISNGNSLVIIFFAITSILLFAALILLVLWIIKKKSKTLPSTQSEQNV
jgi:hypothetical protein